MQLSTDLTGIDLHSTKQKKMSVGFVNGSLDLDVIDLNDSLPSATGGSGTSDHFQTSSHSSTPQHNRKRLPQLMLNNDEPKEALLSGIFGLEDKSYDVSLDSSSIQFTIMGGKIKREQYLVFIFIWECEIFTLYLICLCLFNVAIRMY